MVRTLGMILGARIRNRLGIGRSLAQLALAAAVAVAAVGCGSAVYIKRVTLDASSSVAAAKAVDAETWAPYEYTRAIEYLHKAREEAALADFQAANKFGTLAHEAATTAKELAIARAANPKQDDWRPPPSLREDKGADGAQAKSMDAGDEASPKESDGESGGLAPADPDEEPDDTKPSGGKK
jgi:hypothetical protein